jgi:hypothetical protein
MTGITVSEESSLHDCISALPPGEAHRRGGTHDYTFAEVLLTFQFYFALIFVPRNQAGEE